MEKFFEWKDAYRVGVDEIDFQHRNLVQMVNHLHEHIDESKDMRLYVEIFLDQLVTYVDYHFATEERLMRASKYPDFDAHQKVHDALRAQVHDFRDKFVSNEADISEELMAFLKDWLLNHIAGMDTKIGSHLEATGHNRHISDDLAAALNELQNEINATGKK